MYPYIYIILPSYSVIACVGGFFTLLFLYFQIDKIPIEFTEFLKLFIFSIIGGIVGSKLLFAITQIPWLIQNFSFQNMLFLIPQSGYVFYGGLFGVLLTVRIYAGKKRTDKEKIYRMIAPAIPLFHSFGRIGCLFAGCCYGIELKSPIIIGNILKISSFPTQILEFFFEAVLFFILLIISKRNEKADLLKLYLISYSIFRFFSEFFRGDEVRGIYLGISTAQWISGMILVYYGMMIVRKKKCSN